MVKTFLGDYEREIESPVGELESLALPLVLSAVVMTKMGETISKTAPSSFPSSIEDFLRPAPRCVIKFSTEA